MGTSPQVTGVHFDPTSAPISLLHLIEHRRPTFTLIPTGRRLTFSSHTSHIDPMCNCSNTSVKDAP